jgi:subtilisin family serine protease
MLKSYNISAKKSIFWLLAGWFMFCFVSPAKAIVPNDPEYPYQLPVYEQVNALAIWDMATGSRDVVVAIIDTGVDFDHPDLKDNVWKNPGEIVGNGIDDDNNGYVDDIFGWNFVENDGLTKAPDVGGFDNEHEPQSHGTVIAGLIGAKGNNGIDGAGLNWNVQIMALRAIDNYGSGSYADIGKAIAYAADNGADIISISFVGDAYDAPLHDALKQAYEKGILVVLAAGNSRQTGGGDLDTIPLYPICFDDMEDNWLLGVTSIDSGGLLSDFANYGTCVDLVAPGENSFSTQRAGTDNGYKDFGGAWQGTSFAVPYVAGTAALIKSLRPDWTAKEIIQTILSTADDIDKYNPAYAGRLGYGRINVERAVKKALLSRAEQAVDRLCWTQKNKLYCYDIAADKKIFLTSFALEPISFDWLGQNYAAALTQSRGIYEINLLNGLGVSLKKWSLGSVEKFSRIKFVYQGNENRIAVYGVNQKTGQVKLKYFDMAGNRLGEVNLPKAAVEWSVLNDGRVVTAKIAAGKIGISTYSDIGVKASEYTGPAATEILGMTTGNFWTGAKDSSSAVLYRQGNSYFRVVYDLSSGAYKRETLAKPAGLWRLRGSGGDSSQTAEVLFYRENGGIFDVFGNGGKVVRSVKLPALRQ